ncbi:MAG: hypothetical protein K6B40_01680 [Firmicutes bacterium]|nr:hypothetical protein [Bacillota bacterium]
MARNVQMLTDFTMHIDEAAFLTEMKVKPGSRREQMCLHLIEKINALLKPKAGFCEAVVEELDESGMTVDGVRFTGTLFADRLKVGQKLYPFLCSCGKEAGDLEYTVWGDVLQQYWADVLMEKSLRCIGQALEERVSAYIQGEFIARFNPGSLPAWPLMEQRPLFQLLGEIVPAVGVELTDHFIMLPQKSVSGFYFSSEQEYHNCSLCPRLHCPTRQTEFIGG